MDDMTRHSDRLPDCDCHECAIYERNRLRAELSAERTCKESLLVALKNLRAELTEARKPDCFRCAYWFACRTLIKDDCGGGDKFVPKRDPVRLYEKEEKL